MSAAGPLHRRSPVVPRPHGRQPRDTPEWEDGAVEQAGTQVGVAETDGLDRGVEALPLELEKALGRLGEVSPLPEAMHRVGRPPPGVALPPRAPQRRLERPQRLVRQLRPAVAWGPSRRDAPPWQHDLNGLHGREMRPEGRAQVVVLPLPYHELPRRDVAEARA